MRTMQVKKVGNQFVISGDGVERLENLELQLEFTQGKLRTKSVSANFRKLLYVLYCNNPLLRELHESFDDFYLAEYAILINQTIESINDLRDNRANLYRKNNACPRVEQSDGASSSELLARASGYCHPCYWDGFYR